MSLSPRANKCGVKYTATCTQPQICRVPDGYLWFSGFENIDRQFHHSKDGHYLAMDHARFVQCTLKTHHAEMGKRLWTLGWLPIFSASDTFTVIDQDQNYAVYPWSAALCCALEP